MNKQSNFFKFLPFIQKNFTDIPTNNPTYPITGTQSNEGKMSEEYNLADLFDP